MIDQKFSDLPFGCESDLVVLVRPAATAPIAKEEFLRRKEFMQVFDDVVGFSGMIHAGSLQCHNYCDTPGEPIAWIPCGGTLSMRSVNDQVRFRHLRDRANYAITCSGTGCDMCLGLDYITKPEIVSLMLHLTMKQMVPNLQACNFVDCSATPLRHDKMSEIEEIRKIGTISVASRFLFGTISAGGYFSMSTEFYSMGFMLMPGMNTRNGCDGFDEWLKFLVEKKFEVMKTQHDALKPLLIGPKPRTRS